MKVKCDNCERIFEETDLSIPAFFSRVEPGSIMPSGECPKCGSFVYLHKETEGIPFFPKANWPVANKVLEKRNSADYQCYMALKNLMSELDDGLELGALSTYITDALDNGRLCIEARDDLNDKFMKALVGQT